MRRKLITIVVPVYKEEKNLSNLLVALNSVTSSISDFDWEYIFVNDGSPDSSITILGASNPELSIYPSVLLIKILSWPD